MPIVKRDFVDGLRLTYIEMWKLFWVTWVHTVQSSRSWKLEEEDGRMSWVVSKGEWRGTGNSRRIYSVLLTLKMNEGCQEPIMWTVFRSRAGALLTARKKPISQWSNWTLPTAEMNREVYGYLQSLQKGTQPCQPLVLALWVHKQSPYWGRVLALFKSVKFVIENECSTQGKCLCWGCGGVTWLMSFLLGSSVYDQRKGALESAALRVNSC